jgi:hypothetical protein
VAADTVSRDSHGAGGGFHRDLIGPPEAALIEEIYAEDFARFGYSRLGERAAA